MIHRAKHHWLIYTFFNFYTRYKLRKNFHEVISSGNYTEQNRPILIVANHISWWDGFWINYFNLTHLHRKFCFLMREDQLNKHWQFKYTGGISVKHQSKSIMETIEHAAEILSVPENALLVFPQGKIQSIHNNTFRFEKGLEKIIQKTDSAIDILFLVNTIDFLTNEKPTLFTFYKVYNGQEQSVHSIEQAYQKFFNSSIGQLAQIKK